MAEAHAAQLARDLAAKLPGQDLAKISKIRFGGSFSTMLTIEMGILIILYPYLWPGRLATQADPWP